MSNHLEQIVRPSQAPSIRPASPSQILATPKIPENEPIVWGSSGQTVFELKAHAEGSNDTHYPETQRTYDVVKVFNKDDKDQFIETEVMTEYQGRNKNTQDKITLRYLPTQADANNEIVSKGNVRKGNGS